MTFIRLTIAAGLLLAVSACATTSQNGSPAMGAAMSAPAAGTSAMPAAGTSAAPAASTHSA